MRVALTGAVREVCPITGEAPEGREAVLLLGNYRVSLVIARQLNGAGFSVIAGGPPDTVIAKSRYVERVWDHPDIFRNDKTFLASLNELLDERPDISMILPVSEPALLKLGKLAGQLPVPLAAVDRRTVEACCDKGKMAQSAAELEVPQAPFAIAGSMEELVSASEQVGYPCVARPNDGHNEDFKAYFIQDREQLLRMFPEWPEWHESLLVQAHAGGPRYNRYFVAHEGVILDSLDVRIVRTDRPDGSGYAVEGVSVPPLPGMDAPTNRMIEHLGYTGVGCAQYLVDEQRGLLSFLEINPRIGGNYAFAHSCGLDLVTPLLALARNQAIPPRTQPAAHTLNKRYIWLYGDLIGLMSSAYRRELGPRAALAWLLRCCGGLTRADTHLTWDRQDLGPTKWFAKRLGEALLVMLWDSARYVKRRVTVALRL